MKATWLMALVSYAATVFSIWLICMPRSVAWCDSSGHGSG